MSEFRIVAFDGGGVRGALMLALLVRLDELVPGWRAKTNMYAGTSVGALIALGLAAGFEPAELLAHFRSSLARVFKDSCWDDVKDLGTALGAEYQSDGLTEVLNELFGKRRLGDLAHWVVVPSLRLEGGGGAKPKFFHNLPGSDSDALRLAADVAAYSAAAPVYFPAVDGYADGGLVANHPGLAAVSAILDQRNILTPRPTLDEIRLLSFGTGRDPVQIPEGTKDWGWVRWARPLIRLMVEATVSVPDFQCRQLLGDHYQRIEPVFDPGQAPSLDALEAVPELERIALTGMAESVSCTAAWLRAQWTAPSANSQKTEGAGKVSFGWRDIGRAT